MSYEREIPQNNVLLYPGLCLKYVGKHTMIFQSSIETRATDQDPGEHLAPGPTPVPRAPLLPCGTGLLCGTEPSASAACPHSGAPWPAITIPNNNYMSDLHRISLP